MQESIRKTHTGPTGTGDRAFTGLEAAIILIAFITVAAVFSYVVLGLGFSTTQKSREVIQAGMYQASSVLIPLGGVYGVSESGGTIDLVNFSLALSPGSDAIDFEKLVIVFSTSQRLEQVRNISGFMGSSTSPGTWAVTGGANQQGNANLLLEKGEQFTISVHPSVGINPNERFSIEIRPPGGSTLAIERTAPPDIQPVNPLF